MRLEKFDSGDQLPIGEDEAKKVFVDPNNEDHVIAEYKGEDAETILDEKDTPRQLKGRYYLTEIVHALMPDNIPDIHQAGEDADGIQTIDSERVARENEIPRVGEFAYEAGERINGNLDKDTAKVDKQLHKLGLGFNADESYGEYTKDEAGNAYYLEPFKPWQKNPSDPTGMEVLFDVKKLRKAIAKMPDGLEKKQSEGYLERLLVLAEEQKQENIIEMSKPIPEGHPDVAKLEAEFLSFELKFSLENLSAITTKEEAMASAERKAAKDALAPIETQLSKLMKERKMTEEKFSELHQKKIQFSRAIGMIDGKGMVDHTR